MRQRWPFRLFTSVFVLFVNRSSTFTRFLRLRFLPLQLIIFVGKSSSSVVILRYFFYPSSLSNRYLNKTVCNKCFAIRSFFVPPKIKSHFCWDLSILFLEFRNRQFLVFFWFLISDRKTRKTGFRRFSQFWTPASAAEFSLPMRPSLLFIYD